MRNNIRVLRAQKGLSQNDLAKLVGVTRQTIISLEKNRYNPSLKLAYKISNVFHVNVEEVFPKEENLK